MANNKIDLFGDFLNQIKQQNTLLKNNLDEWDAILNTGLSMVKDLEKVCDCSQGKTSLLFLKEIFSSGQGLSFLILNRFAIIKDIAETNRQRTYDA